MKPEKIVFYLYNRLQDPLITSNILLYIRQLNTVDHHRYDIALITYEDAAFPIPEVDKQALLAVFEALNITWRPLKWHKGTSAIAKVLDLFSGFRTLFYLRFFKNYRHAVTLASVAGSYLYLITRIVPMRYYLYQYEPHSDFALESGAWEATSRHYKTLNRAEQKAARKAAVISTGTDAMISRLKSWGVQAPMFKITSVANEALFRFSETDRQRIRKENDLSENETVIIYPGKLNGLYCSPKQLLDVFLGMQQQLNDTAFLVISPDSAELMAVKNNNPRFHSLKIIALDAVEQSLLPAYLSAADFGFVAIAPTPSQQFRSPIKVGEYLANGLPYIVCRGISEDAEYAEDNKVGVVLEAFGAAAVEPAVQQLLALLAEDRGVLRQRCREKGATYRGFDKQFATFLQALGVLLKTA